MNHDFVHVNGDDYYGPTKTYENVLRHNAKLELRKLVLKYVFRLLLVIIIVFGVYTTRRDILEYLKFKETNAHIEVMKH